VGGVEGGGALVANQEARFCRPIKQCLVMRGQKPWAGGFGHTSRVRSDRLNMALFMREELLPPYDNQGEKKIFEVDSSFGKACTQLSSARFR